MDPLTHALSGAIIAKGIPRQPLPRGSVWLLVGMAMLPDIDIVLKLVSDTFYLRHHRGVTHSVLMLPMWLWLIYSLLPRQQKQYRIMPWLIGATLLMHIFLDLVTSFGTMSYAPFSDARESFDLIFIIDPIFTALLLIPLLLMPAFRAHGRTLGIIALALMTFYTGITYHYHEKGLTLARQHHPNAENVYALPQPFSPFRWMLIASYPNEEQRTVVDFQPAFSGTTILFPESLAQQFSNGSGQPDSLHWQRLANLQSVEEAKNLPGVGFYRWFARFPVLVEKNGNYMEFADLRFETMKMDRQSFRLRIELGEQPKAWLIWRGEQKHELTDVKAPATSW